MIRRVRFALNSARFFSREPLSHETFISRLATFANSSDVSSPSPFIDCIVASRRLQRHNPRHDFRNDFLALAPPVSNQQLEALMWRAVSRNLNVDVVRRYLLEQPWPTNGGNVVQAVSQMFSSQLESGVVDESLVRLGLDVLLKNNDYSSCFQLIDQTVASSMYLEWIRRKLTMHCGIAIADFGLVNAVEWTLMPLVPFSLTLGINLAALLSLLYFYWPLVAPKGIGRTAWRDSNTAAYNYAHNRELFLVSRVLMYFEEHNEVNLKNYHLSKVRRSSEHLRSDDYVIEMPMTNQMIPMAQASHVTQWTLDLQKLLQQQIKKRKMVLQDLPEELQFIEFWMTQGENFEWTEPDQDPAEIIQLDLHTTK